MIDGFRQDIRYALRSLRRAPLFAIAVAGTIGVGLGFVGSAFTVVNAYLLKPFDVREPHALYEVSWDSVSDRRHRFSIDDLQAMQSANPVFSDVFGFAGFQISFGEAVIYAQAVTGNYFDAVGVRPFLGRLLEPRDASRPGEQAVVVLSHDAWRTRFGADPGIVGADVRLGQRQYTVVGVAQPGFTAFGDAPISFWVPLTIARDFPMADPYAPERPSMVSVMARLGTGVSSATATAWFSVWLEERVAGRRAEEAPTLVRVESRATRIPMTPATGAMFSAIIAAFGLVLLIACANAANLMLARGLARQQEIAVRLSVGASRRRIVGQLLVESLLLAVPAAVLGYAATFVTGRVVPQLILETWPEGLPPIQALLVPMEPDVRVAALLAAAAVGAAVLFGLSPALQTSKTSLSRAARGEFGVTIRVSGVRSALVIGQIAVCALFLMTAAGLLGELRRLATVETGLNIDGVADLRVDREHRAAMVERLVNDPRVAEVAATWRPPLYGALWQLGVTPSGSNDEVTAGFIVVSPEYFELFNIPVLRGRSFTAVEADTQADVVLVSARTARRFWPNADPIGQTLEITVDSPSRRERHPAHRRVRVIGVTGDVTSGSIMDGTDATCVYFPTSVRAADDIALLMRSRTDLAALRAAVAAATNEVRKDAAFPLYPMRQVVGLQLWALQGLSNTVSLLGLVALLLAVSGTYAVVAFLVAQRTREFGIRMALGATASWIVGRVMAQSMRLSVVGVLTGAALAAAISRLLASIIEIMPALGPTPYLIGAMVVVAATIAAAGVPSLRASKVDPARALRAE